METGHLSILSSKGQLTVPKSLREQLNLREGQRLLLETSEGRLIIKKAQFKEVGEEFEEAEWNQLRKLASKKGKIYKTGKAFLKSLKMK